MHADSLKQFVSYAVVSVRVAGGEIRRVPFIEHFACCQADNLIAGREGHDVLQKRPQGRVLSWTG